MIISIVVGAVLILLGYALQEKAKRRGFPKNNVFYLWGGRLMIVYGVIEAIPRSIMANLVLTAIVVVVLTALWPILQDKEGKMRTRSSS